MRACVRTWSTAAVTMLLTSVLIGPSGALGATLISHWAFDESSGTTAHDSAGSFDGTLAGGAAFVPGGISGNALSLTASNGSLVNMGTSFPGFTSGEDFSIVVWVKTTTTANNTLALAKHEAFSENGYFLAINPTGGGGQANKATFVASEQVANSVTSTSSVNDGAWHQIVGVYQHPNPTGTQTIYVDGSPVEATSATAAMVANGAPFLIGGPNSSGTPTATTDALVDEVRVYSGMLTDQEIDALLADPGLPPTPTPTPTVTATRTSTPVPTTTPTATVASQPSATPTFVAPDAVLDDFFSDKAKIAKGAAKFAPAAGVHVVTALDDVVVDVVKPLALGLPADKNAEGVLDPVTHLASFQIKPVKGSPKPVKHTALVVINQLGTLSLDAVKPERLLLPAVKALVDPPPPFDPQLQQVSRFLCSTVKITKGASKFPGAQVSVSDQFTSPAELYVLKKPTRLCVPATVDGAPPTNAAVHLLCYKAALAKAKPAQAKFTKRLGVIVVDQLGIQRLDVTGQDELCIPTLRAP